MAGNGRLNVNTPGRAAKVRLLPHFLCCFMAATLKKGQLPTKICATCGLPFEYRKKWRNNWEAVKYCSEKCQRNKASAATLTKQAREGS